MHRFFVIVTALYLCPLCLHGTDYDVGPSQPYTAINDVPWESLGAGDSVRIHWRSTPYAEKILVSTGGTIANPITIEGIPDAGRLPLITGDGATTRSVLDYNGARGLITLGEKILTRDVGGDPLTYSDGTLVKNIIIQNLILTSARPGYNYTDHEGTSQNYSTAAATIYVQYGENISVINCEMKDCGNGFFTTYLTKNVLLESCYIYDNGISGSAYQHNSYCESQGMVYQYNHYGPLRTGCNGNNLKDRSIGTVVRYNFIESGNRQLDLVNVDDPSYLPEHYDLFFNDPDYWTVYVYGNILVEHEGDGNAQICHFGGDAGGYGSYKTDLYFYNNTIISTRTSGTSLFMLSRNEQYCDSRNNIIYLTAAGSTLGMLDGPDFSRGHLTLRANWLKPGWVDSRYTMHTMATIDIVEPNIEGTDPGFTNYAGGDYTLATGSPCADTAIAPHSSVVPDHSVIREYVLHLTSTSRADADDLGAFMNRNDTPGTLRFQTSTYTATENSGTLTVTVLRENGSDGPCTVTVSSLDGSAIAGTDFNTVNTVLSWLDGEPGAKTFSVTIIDNGTYSGDRDFSLDLTPGTSGVLTITPEITQVTITEDDAIPSAGAIRWVNQTATALETAGSVTIQIERFGGSTGIVTVSVSTADGTALAGQDYVAATVNLSWSDGVMGIQTVDVTILDDSSIEGDESFSVSMGAPTGSAVRKIPYAIPVTVSDPEDIPPTPTFGGSSGGGCGLTEYSNHQGNLLWSLLLFAYGIVVMRTFRISQVE